LALTLIDSAGARWPPPNRTSIASLAGARTALLRSLSVTDEVSPEIVDCDVWLGARKKTNRGSDKPEPVTRPRENTKNPKPTV
jgi:hypothetical protein